MVWKLWLARDRDGDVFLQLVLILKRQKYWGFFASVFVSESDFVPLDLEPTTCWWLLPGWFTDSCEYSKERQWLRIRVDVPVAQWLRIRADSFYLFNHLSPHIVRTLVCHRRSCGTFTRICSLPRGKWLRIQVDVLTIRLPVFIAHGLKIRADCLRYICPYL